MSFSVEAANQSASRINAALELSVNRPRGWSQKVYSSYNPLDEAAVRQEAEALLDSLLDAYSTGDEQQRSQIRALFAKNYLFGWATGWAMGMSGTPTTLQGFRKQLLRLSAENGGRDLRDTIVAVTYLRDAARKAGLNIRPVLEEVATMSSAEAVSRMGSLQQVLLNALNAR